MRVLLPPAVSAEIRADAEARYPREACGFLVGSASPGSVFVDARVEAPNLLGPSGRDGFRVPPREFLALEDRLRGTGRWIVGFYHSHPDGLPETSALDRANMWPEYAYVIVPTERGRAQAPVAWRRAATGGTEPLPVEIVVGHRPNDEDTPK